MLKIVSKIVLATGFIALTAMLTRPELEAVQPNRVDNFSFVENQLLSSSRYTQPDAYEQSVIDRFNSLYRLSYDAQELIDLDFLFELEDNFTKVYFEKDSFSVLIKDKATGYFYSSRPEFQGFSETREDNTANRNLMNSGLWIESVRTNNVSNSSVQIESLYTLADVSYENNGSQDLDNIDLTRPYLIESNSYDKEEVSVTVNQTSLTRLSTSISLKKYGFNFEVELGLTNGKFSVFFSPSSISETNDTYRLMALQFFPYLGSVREDVAPGYFVIPDGVGAMVRTDSRLDTTFQSDYYGSDLGYLRTSVADLTLPIFGIIQSVNQFGIMAEITTGSEHSTLLANFWGRNTRYHRMTNRFNVRRIFRNIINRAGDGNDVIPEEVVNQDFEVLYHTLQGEKATYVGVANTYQQSLISQDIFAQEQKGSTPLHTSYLIAEQEPNIFGTSRVSMTSYSEVKAMYNSLKDIGIENQTTTLLGWSEDGFTAIAPYRTRFIDGTGLRALISTITEDENEVYLDQEYLVGSDRSQRINFNNDVARNYSRLKMSFESRRLDNQNTDTYFLYPNKAMEKLNLDVNTIEATGATGLSMPRFGNTLFSYYDGERHSRTDTLNTISIAKEKYSQLALHRPNAYMFDLLSAYLDMPVTNSQFDIYTDLIPLIPIVLKGFVPMFTPYLNFNALGIERLLQMIDFGVNPSYLLTDEPTSNLRFTLSNRYYTTQFLDFENDIENTYDFVSSALDRVINESIVSRVMLTVGVSKVTYSNGVSIIVNYRQVPFTSAEVNVEALSYKVVNV